VAEEQDLAAFAFDFGAGIEIDDNDLIRAFVKDIDEISLMRQDSPGYFDFLAGLNALCLEPVSI
jgi:hypothetical protein